MQQLELNTNKPNFDLRKIRQKEVQNEKSDENEYISIEEAFEHLESETLNFKEAAEFMEVSEEEFMELLKIEKPFSKNFAKQMFPAQFLIDLKLKTHYPGQVD